MKKLLTALLICAFIFTLCACGAEEIEIEVPKDDTQSMDMGDIKGEIMEPGFELQEIKALSGIDHIGLKVSELEEMYGSDYTAETYQGAYYINYHKDEIPYGFLVLIEGDEPISEKRVKTVQVAEGGFITQGVAIGATVDELSAAYGTTLEVEFNDFSGVISGGLEIDGYQVIIDFTDGVHSDFATIMDKNY